MKIEINIEYSKHINIAINILECISIKNELICKIQKNAKLLYLSLQTPFLFLFISCLHSSRPLIAFLENVQIYSPVVNKITTSDLFLAHIM